MQIKHVEELVGITRKNIRFYEEQGLLRPQRADNGYREYHEEEIWRLKQIKLLRKLAVPIEEIKRVFSGECGLDICLERHLEELERKKNGLEQMQEFSRKLIDAHATLGTLDVDESLEEMERLGKEGVRLMDVNRTDIRRKKTFGAFIGVGIMTAFMLISIAIVLWANAQETMPKGLLALCIAVPVIVIVCSVAVLVERIREIKGGEEDEAFKY